jgi:hypothetical protein
MIFLKSGENLNSESNNLFAFSAPSYAPHNLLNAGHGTLNHLCIYTCKGLFQTNETDTSTIFPPLKV